MDGIQLHLHPDPSVSELSFTLSRVMFPFLSPDKGHRVSLGWSIHSVNQLKQQDYLSSLSHFLPPPALLSISAASGNLIHTAHSSSSPTLISPAAFPCLSYAVCCTLLVGLCYCRQPGSFLNGKKKNPLLLIWSVLFWGGHSQSPSSVRPLLFSHQLWLHVFFTRFRNLLQASFLPARSNLSILSPKYSHPNHLDLDCLASSSIKNKTSKHPTFLLYVIGIVFLDG